MFERFRNNGGERHDDGAVATADRPVTTRDTTGDEGRFARTDATTERREVRARQHEEFGGLNWGAAFFGWLVAIGMAAILLAILSAAGTAFGLSEVSESEASSNAETLGIVGGALLILVLATAYYCGGYVSGRMSRFDGGRQGFGTWVIGLIVTIVLAVAGAIFGAEYNVLESLNLPRIPVEEGALTAGAAIALAAVVVLTLLAAMGGGKAGERYHRKIDKHGFRG
jgi:heme/copper-type cytochrome/quinol oxidase subunit 1